MSPQNQNQFGMSVVQGQLDLLQNPNTIACQVDASQSGSLVPGQPVKLVNSLGGVPKVIGCTADTDTVFGFVNYNTKLSSWVAGDVINVSFAGNCMYMTASAAIARGAPVKPVISGVKVVTAGAGAKVAGYAFDGAAANNDLIRVMILGFGQSPSFAGAVALAAAAAVADIATADATDLASAEALANATKARFNTLLANMRTAGSLAP